MTDLFLKVLDMSLTASAVILFVLAARLVLKRCPRIFSYLLWAVVLFRLLCPVSIQAPQSVLELTELQSSVSQDQLSSVSYVPARLLPSHFEPAQPSGEDRTETAVRIPVMTIAAWIWLAGMGVMIGYSWRTCRRLRDRLQEAVPLSGNVWLADRIDTPFVMGLLDPRIYLPSGVPEEERSFILAHERHHLARKDNLVKFVAFCALCLHWFNPLVWLAFALAGEDMEMSCDEAVLRKLGDRIRADYCAALLRLSAKRRFLAGMPLAFGEGDTGSRIRNLAKWKKPKVWLVLVCILVCIAVLLYCGVNPQQRVLDLGQNVRYHDLTCSITPYMEYHWEDEALVFRENGQTLGGIVLRPAPEFPLEVQPEEGEHWNAEQWLAALGVPEALEPEKYSWSIASGLHTADGYLCYGDLAAAYRPVPTDEARGIHFLIVEPEGVYDIWFDRAAAERNLIEMLMSTVIIDGKIEEKTLAELTRNTGPRGCGYGDLAYTLPEGFTGELVEAEDFTKEEWKRIRNGERNRNMYVKIFRESADIIGGITDYALSEDTDFSTWRWEELGLWEDSEATLTRTQEAPIYGEAQVRYTGSLNGEPVDRLHTFYFSEDKAYVLDMWFDLTRTDMTVAELFLDSAYIDNHQVKEES